MTFPHILAAPVGSHRVPRKWWQMRRGGWLTVERDAKGVTSVMWTSARETHQPLAGPATTVDVDTEGRLVGYWESALSMWLVWGYGRGGEAERQRGMVQAAWMDEQLGRLCQ